MTSLKKIVSHGFTIVELLIVIVVIGILAAISIVAYNGIAAKARDAQREQDVKTIAKALEMYYTDNGYYPASYCAPSCPSPKKINASWATTSDGSWNVLEAALVPKYISKLPKDPSASVETLPGPSGGFNYDYTISWIGSDCSGTTPRYILVYRLESQAQRHNVSGSCTSGSPVDFSIASEYIGIK